MAWTSPATWSVSEVVTASKMNLHVRDNLNYLKGNAGAVTISDELLSVVAAGGSLVAQGTNNSSFARYKMLCKDSGGTTIDWRFLANGTGASEFGIFEVTTERMRVHPGGNVMIGTGIPAGKLHVLAAGAVSGAGFAISSLSAVTTIQTMFAAGTVARGVMCFILDRNNTGAGLNSPAAISAIAALSGSFTYTNTDTITVAVTAGGAITCARTSGTNGTHDIVMLALFL